MSTTPSTSPAPWRLCLNDDIIAADDVCVARKHWDVHEENGTEARWRADAALICAAPAMLELLRELADTYRLNAADPPFAKLRALLASLGEAAP